MKYHRLSKAAMVVFMQLLLFLFVSNFAFSQQDSIKLVKYTSGFRFKDGLYLTHSQLLNNNPIPINHIISKFNRSDFDFFSKLLNDEQVEYYDQYGLKKEIQVKDLWGFCNHGSIYINWGDDFCRIPVMGKICHFIASVTVTDDRFYNPAFGYSTYNMPTNTTRTEIYQFIMHFDSGKVLEYSSENILIILMDDKELYDEFNALSKKKQNQLKFLYLRKYNDKHPLFIPVD